MLPEFLHAHGVLSEDSCSTGCVDNFVRRGGMFKHPTNYYQIK